MQISLINSNLTGPDAVGNNIIQQARFFQRRGYDVRIFLDNPPVAVGPDIVSITTICSLSDLIGGHQPFFTGSDLFIYHYPVRYPLLESIKGIDYGAVLFDYHGVTPPELWGVDHDRELIMRSVEGVALVHHADLAIAHSSFTQRELIERYNYPAERTRVLPYAVPLEQYQPGEADPALVRQYDLSDRRVLLYVGRMAGNKRIDLLVRALPGIQAEVPGTRLLLVGDDRNSPGYVTIANRAKALARELGVANDVIFTGPTNNPAPYYHLADVFVTASLHEGFCVPVIEAMASGVPVVASRSAALPETVGEAGLTFEPENVADLVRQVVTLLCDDTLRTELVRKGIERAQTFSVDHYEARLEAIIRAVTPHERRVIRQQGGVPGRVVHWAREAPPEIPAQGAFLSNELAKLRQEAAVGQPGYVVRSDKPLVGPLIAWVRRNMTSHLREPYLDPIIDRQVRFNLHLVSYLQQWVDDLNRLALDLTRHEQTVRDLAAELDTQVAELKRRLEAVESRQNLLDTRLDLLEPRQKLAETRLATLANRLTELAQRVTDFQTTTQLDPAELQRRLALIEQVLAEIPDTTGEKLEWLSNVLNGSSQPTMDFSYRACHDRVGGSFEIGRQLYAPFADLFVGKNNVLDIGCGKGPFLSLLRERGIRGQGVDLDDDMVALCRQAGFDVVQMDGMAYLATLDDESLDGIFSAHLIEHLPKPQLVKFLELCQAKLQPGGLIVLITPNGAGLTIFHSTFYKDLTHQQPLHPEAIRFLLEATGFRNIQVDFLSPTPDEKLKLVAPDGAEGSSALIETLNQNFHRLNELLFGNLDCAICAVK